MTVHDRSYHAGVSAPRFWGPGPWDDEVQRHVSWTDRAYQSGDIRSVPADVERGGGPVVPVQRHRREMVKDLARVRYPKQDGTARVECWCGRRTVRVPTRWIFEGRTRECDDRCLAYYTQKRRLWGRRKKG